MLRLASRLFGTILTSLVEVSLNLRSVLLKHIHIDSQSFYRTPVGPLPLFSPAS